MSVYHLAENTYSLLDTIISLYCFTTFVQTCRYISFVRVFSFSKETEWHSITPCESNTYHVNIGRKFYSNSNWGILMVVDESAVIPPFELCINSISSEKELDASISFSRNTAMCSLFCSNGLSEHPLYP